ncbi:hypothetical protein C8R44DRAFT_578666, partial [Mycena epipterygia]
LREIKYSVDNRGRRYADCAYVEIKGSNFGMQLIGKDIVPIVPMTTYFPYVPETGLKYSVGRKQLPLLPTYAYTHLNGTVSLQSFYVMVSRATFLKSLAVLHNFKSTTMHGRLDQDFRDKFACLEILDARTRAKFERSDHTYI